MRLFRIPSPSKIAERQHADAQRALLDAEIELESARARVEALKTRERRLADYLRNVQ